MSGCVRVLGSGFVQPGAYAHSLTDSVNAWVSVYPTMAYFFFFVASLHVCMTFLCAHRVSLNPLQANRNPVCQLRLPKQSAIKPLTCSSRKPMLTAKVGANETRKCERLPEKHICVLMGVRKTLVAGSVSMWKRVRVRETLRRQLARQQVCLYIPVDT